MGVLPLVDTVSVEVKPSEASSGWRNDEGFDTHFEKHSPVELSVRGSIPAYAAGTLYRTGPGGYKVDTDKGNTYAASHWFDGFSQVHRFQIKVSEDSSASVRVTYNSRRTVDEMLARIKETGTLDGITFGQKRDPCQSFFKKVTSTFTPPPQPTGPSSMNVGVTLSVNMPGLGNSNAPSTPMVNGHSTGIKTLYAKTDANRFQKINPETLEPIGLASQTDLHPSLKGPMSGAHAKSDPKTGDIYNFNLELGVHAVYRVFCTSASTGETEILATIPAPPAYIHSLFLSESYVILCVWNSHLTKGGASILWKKNFVDSIAPFDSSQPAKWFVVDRRTGKGLIATYDSDPFYCFHTINAWEEPSPSDPSKTDIVADLTMYDNLDVIHRFYYENLLSSAPGHRAYAGSKGDSTRGSLRRFRLPDVTSLPTKRTKRAAVDFTTPKSSAAELPIINPAYLTKPHRYTYGVTDRGLSSFVDGLVKFDNATQTPMHWDQHAQSPGEPIFVANPEGTAEDDGVLLSVVLDGTAGKSYLLCLDARNMKELGRAEVDGAIGFGFHGTHVPAGRKYGGDI